MTTLPAPRRPWRQTKFAGAFFCAVLVVSAVDAQRDAARLAASHFTAPLPKERGALCRAALFRAEWPSPATPHTWRVGRALIASLATVEHAWPSHCAVLVVTQDPAGRIARVTVLAATGGEHHKAALIRVTSHNQGLGPPPSAAEARHVYALRRLDYAPDA